LRVEVKRGVEKNRLRVEVKRFQVPDDAEPVLPSDITPSAIRCTTASSERSTQRFSSSVEEITTGL
jgi:hypothetical protein